MLVTLDSRLRGNERILHRSGQYTFFLVMRERAPRMPLPDPPPQLGREQSIAGKLAQPARALDSMRCGRGQMIAGRGPAMTVLERVRYLCFAPIYRCGKNHADPIDSGR